MTIRPIVLILIPALILAAGAAEARFMLADAHFDNRPAGSSLARRGALFGEPVSGPYDRNAEIIVDQGGGNMAVRLPDTQLLGPSEMYWGFRENLELTGGRLTARIEFTPQAVGDYTIALRAGDQVTDFVAIDITDGGSTSRFHWRDAGNPTPTFFAFASNGTTYDLQIDMNLNLGTYTLYWNGSAVVTDQAHGLAGHALSCLVVGHLGDLNLAGEFDYDLVQLDWRPDDSVPDLLLADFSDKPVGEPLQARGAFYGEPVSITPGNPPYVEIGLPNGNKAMVLENDSGSSSAATRFQFYNNVEPELQPVSISFAVAFDELDFYSVYIRESGGATAGFMNLTFGQSGLVTITDDAGMAAYQFMPYTSGVRYDVELTFEPVLDMYSVWIDGERIVHRRSHGITDREVGSIVFSISHQTPGVGTMRVDRIRVHTLGIPLSAPDSAPAAQMARLVAAPNPFNPATELRFELPRPGQVTLDIFDARGQRVRRLVSGQLPAGLHQPLWQGRNDAGRPIASGVYHARLTTIDGVSTRKLTLAR